MIFNMLIHFIKFYSIYKNYIEIFTFNIKYNRENDYFIKNTILLNL